MDKHWINSILNNKNKSNKAKWELVKKYGSIVLVKSNNNLTK